VGNFIDSERQHQNTMRLDGKVAVITGGGTGIGAAAARSLAAAGAKVAVTGRRPEPLQAVAQEIGGLAVAGDATKADEVRATLSNVREHFGAPVDIVVANAGGHGLAAATDTTDEGWATSWDINVTTAFLLAREALPDLIETQGSIVVVSSLAGVFAGPDVLGYTTGKHALIGLTKSLARDYGKHGVRANAVCPGWVRTPMADEQMDELAALGDGLDREQAYALATSEVPLRRAASAEDIANIVTFLASPLSAAMTGTTVMADCGAHVVDLPTLAFERLQQH
jgi:meso-butanediol dehydrogenase/(S,S)-butanediol dehydrogenase/diacetyl reductase